MILGLLIILLLNGCSLFRQYGNIEGYVYVPDTGNKGAIIIRDSNQVPTGYKPLPGAKVSVQDFYKFVFTDINGYFLLEDVITGLVNLIIEPPINSGYNSLTTQVMVEPDTTVPVGTYGAVSLPSEGADHWDAIINQIDYTNYPSKIAVYVQILDPVNNTPIIGATSKNFEVEINGNKINNLSVTQAPGTTCYPASTSLVIDRSGSMEGVNYDDQPLNDAKEAAKTFVNFMSSSDRAETISFADGVTVDQPFTNDKQALNDAIDGLSSGGATALYDAIWQGLDDTATEANPRKAVVALTDGGENNSSSDHGGVYWWGDPDNSLLIAHAKSLNIPVYTIGLAGFDFTKEKVVRSYTTTEKDLQEIANETGGEYFYAPTSADLEHIYVEITQRLEQQYIITFTDNTGIAEGYLTVKVNYNQISGEDSKDYEPPYGTTNVHLTNVIPRDLLTLIDAYANSYYNSVWNLTLDQYKAWIATIAWAEGGLGGFTAHSQGRPGVDFFPHISLGYDFTFSTGIGPFQLDRGGYDNWEYWPTINKLDPEKALKTVLNQHYNQFPAGSTLQVFSNSSKWVENSFKWVGVWPSNVESRWLEITGSEWDDNNDEKNFILNWEEIKGWLANDDTIYRYESNVCPLGYRKWNIKASDNIFTDTNKPVIFDGDYSTWRITARNWNGIILFYYYYTYNPNTKIEVWSYDDSSTYKYIFIREYSTGCLSEGCENTFCGFTLSHSALTP